MGFRFSPSVTFGPTTIFGPVRSSPRLGDGFFSRRSRYEVLARAAKFIAPGEALLGNYGTFKRGADLATRALKDALEDAITSYELKFYIQDASTPDPKWVDFTDRANFRGRNYLRSIGRLSYTAERNIGAVSSRPAQVVLDNSDNFWDAPMPSTVQATYSSASPAWGLLSDSNASTTWKSSSSSSVTPLYHHKAAIRARVLLKGRDVPEDITLGVFLIEDVSTSTDGDHATMKLVPLNQPLHEPAEDIKGSGGWYRHRPVNFLVEEIIRDTYDTASGALPSTFDIDDFAFVENPRSGTAGWVSTSLGRPPMKTVDNGASDAEWKDFFHEVCRATVLWEYGLDASVIGSITTTPDSATVTGSSTEWSTSGNGKSPPAVGDAFVISKEHFTGDGGCTKGQEGHYTITEITDNTTIVLDRPLPGTASESGVSYSIQRLYLGIGSELYRFNPSTQTYYQITTGANQIGADYSIRKIWTNPNYFDDGSGIRYEIWGIALKDHQSLGVTQTMKIFRYSHEDDTFDVWGETGVSGVFMGDMTYRDSENTAASKSVIGHFNYSSNNENMPNIFLPYRQDVQNVQTGGSPSWDWLADVEPNMTSEVNSQPNDFDSDQAHKLPKGYWGAEVSSGPSRLALRYSSGQTGFMVFNSDPGSNGYIVFAKSDGLIYSNYWRFTYHSIDLDQADPTTGSPTVIDLGDGSSNSYIHETPASGTYSTWLPVCGCADPDSGDVFLGLSYFSDDSGPTTPEMQSAIIRIDDVTTAATDPGGTPTARLWVDDTTAANMMMTEMVSSSSNLFIAMTDTSNAMADDEPYHIYHHVKTAAAETTYDNDINDLSIKHKSPEMHQGLKIIGSRLWYQVPQRGVVAYVDDDNGDETENTDPPTIVTAIAAIPESAWIINNTFTQSTYAGYQAFWIAGAAPTFNLIARAEGHFELCTFHHTIGSVIPVADFSGLSKWDALRMLAEVVDARFGFKPDGNFFFKRKPKDKNSLYSFTNIGQSRTLSISKSQGLQNIINYSQRTPYVVRKAPVDVTFDLGPTSEIGQPRNDADPHDFFINYLGITPKQIRLRCVQGGRVAVDATTGIEARFTWDIIRGTTNTTLSGDYTASDEWLQISDSGDVGYQSQITVYGFDDSEDEQVLGEATVGYRVQYTSTDLTLNGAHTLRTDELTVSGGNPQSGTMDNGYTFTGGEIILVGDIDAGTNYEYMYVKYVSATKLYVSRGLRVGDNSGAIDHASGEEIVLIRKGRQVFTYATMDADAGNLYVTGDRVIIDHVDHDEESPRFYNDKPSSNLLNTDLSTDRYWYPIDNEWVQIGGDNTPHSTAVYIKMSTNNNGDRSDEPMFDEGDLVRITTKGMVLEENPLGNRIANDTGSQDAWGTRASRTGNNKFLVDRTAQWVAEREVNEEANPKYSFTIQSILVPWLELLDVVDVTDEKMLPRETGHKYEGYIAEIAYDLNLRGLQTTKIRGISPY